MKEYISLERVDKTLFPSISDIFLENLFQIVLYETKWKITLA